MIYETTISTVENKAKAATRILKPQLEQEWSRDSTQSAPDWTQAVDAGLKTRRMGAESPQRLGLGRKVRIKQGRDFARIRLEGERLTQGCLVTNCRRLPTNSASRVGVITSGKIGNAVVRGRARRLLREVFRLHQHQLAQPVDLVLVARQSLTTKQFADVETDFLKTLRRAGLLK